MNSAEFFNVRPVAQALESLLAHWRPTPPLESLDPREALGRALAQDVHAPEDLPAFPRSTVDGYALRAADSFGASPALPALLRVAGELRMGEAAQHSLTSGSALLIHTGGMLPAGADAVIMLERTQALGDDVELLAPVAPGENVLQPGEDVAAAALLLKAGQTLRAQEIGGLLAAGVTEVTVHARPRVAILSSGDELVPPEATPAPGQIRDINAHTLAALVSEAGGEPLHCGIARDEFDDYVDRARRGHAAADLLVLTAGSSVSARDLTRAVIDRLGAPGVLQHGLAVRPGKPTLLAVCAGKAVIGLPGNPVSALLVARQILLPLLRHWFGASPAPAACVRALLGANLSSASGREDSVPVRLRERDGHLLAEPVFGKSGLIFTLVGADGLVHVPLDSGGLRAGTSVDVQLF
ncbi:MAG: molybdopterin molybdotransferase MoeA [Anaerolineaceae bacterium]|nr:molybdopterin molybdotransferase MoeA [Anaerolineaceae bacterium]MDE0328065.1 molybdopterin molybdotransferase MoeA [Anaerolineaceae bacterium]